MRLNKTKNRARIIGGLLTFGLLVGVLGFLAINVARDLEVQRTAERDNVQWTLSQIEIDYLRMRLASEAVEASDPEGSGLEGLTRAFDIFYSRVDLLQKGSAYAPVRGLPEFDQAMGRISAFLDMMVPLIDGDPADLRQALPAIQARIAGLRPTVRQASGAGIDFFSRLGDARRDAVARTLTQLGFGVLVLLVALALLTLWLGWLNAQNERRRAQVAAASERTRVVIETSLDAVIVADERAHILTFNTAAEQIFGVLAKDAIGRDLADVVVPEHLLEKHKEEMQRFRDTGQHEMLGKGRIRRLARRADGSVFPVEISVETALTEEGDVYVLILRDISARERAEHELVMARDRALASEQAKTDFLATMSHEIRTPLNGLLGNLGLLADTELAPECARYVRNMETSGKLLLRHVTDVLDITRYDAGKLRTVVRPMQVGPLIQDIIDNQSGAACANGTDLSWAWDGDDIGWIAADRDRIESILLNIVGNAVKFTHDGTIHVSLRTVAGDTPDPDQRVLHVSVQDTGIGIPAALQARIFDDFTTGDVAYDREFGGTGLGLGLARRFAEAMDGKITVESARGQGSTFHLRLPVRTVAAPSDEAGDTPACLRAHRAGARILLVEDNPINRTIARETLRRADHEVVEASDGVEAVALADHSRFDLILMDVRMPKMDGRRATQLIRGGTGASARTPIIALTANALAKEQAVFLADGMDDVVTKPVLGDALLSVVDRWASDGDTTDEDAVVAAHLQDLRETLGAESVDSLLSRFSDEVDGLLANAPAAGSERIAQSAHRSAGSAAMFGAFELHEALIGLEDAARETEDPALVQSAYRDAADAWERSRATLGL